MKVSEALRSAKESLNESNWLKEGSYFSLRGYVVCMCAHGAVQAQINERVVAALATPSALSFAAAVVEATSPAAAAAQVAAAVVRSSAATAASRSSAGMAAVAAEEVAAARAAEAAAQVVDVPFTPPWALGLEAHSYLGHVGLTADFNDLPGTKLADVIKKFEQAILLAEANGD